VAGPTQRLPTAALRPLAVRVVAAAEHLSY
jgi:hypothetical protein